MNGLYSAIHCDSASIEINITAGCVFPILSNSNTIISFSCRNVSAIEGDVATTTVLASTPYTCCLEKTSSIYYSTVDSYVPTREMITAAYACAMISPTCCRNIATIDDDMVILEYAPYTGRTNST